MNPNQNQPDEGNTFQSGPDILIPTGKVEVSAQEYQYLRQRCYRLDEQLKEWKLVAQHLVETSNPRVGKGALYTGLVQRVIGLSNAT